MKRENLIKVFIVAIIVAVFSFSDWSLATESSTSLLDVTSKWLHLIVSILSWIRIFFAQGAGEFMTNKWIYGGVIGLDAILWKYWTVVKNVANLGLGFYFVYTIFKGLIDSKGEIIKKVKDTLLWILIAGIGIQASWFLVTVVVDVSTITLVAASSLPSQIVSTSPGLKHDFDATLRDYFGKTEEMVGDFENGAGVSLFSSNRGAFDFLSINKNLPLDKKITEEELFDIIMPNGDSVSGPLHYLGLMILKTTSLVSLNSSSDSGVMGTIFNILLQSLTTIVYSLEMMVLFVVAVIRVIYIWVFIVLSPIVFLLRCIKKADKNLKIDFLDGVTKHFNLSSFFWNVFKPSIVVLGFSLAMIFVTVMNDIIQSNNKKSLQESLDMGGLKSYSRKDSSMGEGDGNQKYLTVMDTDMVGLSIRNAGKTILEFIMCIITVILVYYIIKIAVMMGDGKDFVSTTIQSVQKGVGELVSALPVMPVAGYDKEGKPQTRYLSAGRTFGIGDGNSSLISSKVNRYQGKVNDEYSKQNQIINSWFNDDIGYLSAEEIRSITNAGNGAGGSAVLMAKRDAIVKSEEGKGMKLNPSTAQNNGFWIQEFEKWLENSEGQTINTGNSANDTAWRNMIKWWNTGENKKQGLEVMFRRSNPNEAASVKAYADFFGLNLSVNDWNHLKDADISKLTSTTTS